MAEIAAEQDSCGTWNAAWPEENIFDLWDTLEERFIQLGGASAPNFLRMAGNDTFIFTHDVVKALNKWNAFRGEPKGKKARRQVQEAFNVWASKSQINRAQMSRILALSVD